MRQQINDEQRLVLFQEALKLAAKHIRAHPPSFYEGDFPLELIVGGSKRDPDGMEIANYFLIQAAKQQNIKI